MNRRTGHLAALVAFLLSAGCAPPPQGTPAKTADSGASKRSTSAVDTSQMTRWEQLEAKIPNRQARIDQAISLLEEAKRIKTEGDKLEGQAKKDQYKKAKAKYEEAGTVYDTLQMEAADLDENLWNRRFTTFQRKWDSLSKELKRLGF